MGALCWELGLGWAGALAGCWVGLGLGAVGFGLGVAGGFGLTSLTLKRNLDYRNWKGCVRTRNRIGDGQQQQATSIYFCPEGLGFRS